jgi:hypothetical protein
VVGGGAREDYPSPPGPATPAEIEELLESVF